MSNPLDKHINKELSKKQYAFEEENWNDFKSYQSEFTSLDRKLKEKEYVFQNADWKAFKKYRYLKKNKRNVIFLFIIFLLSLSVALIFTSKDLLYPLFHKEKDLVEQSSIKNQEAEAVIDYSSKKFELNQKENSITEVSKVDQTIPETPNISLAQINSNEKSVASYEEKSRLSDGLNEVVKSKAVRTNKSTLQKRVVNTVKERVANQAKINILSKDLLAANHAELISNKEQKETISTLSNNPEFKRDDHVFQSLNYLDLIFQDLVAPSRVVPTLLAQANPLFVKVVQVRKPLLFELTAGSYFNSERQFYFAGGGVEKIIASKWSLGLNLLTSYNNLEDVIVGTKSVKHFSFRVKKSSQQLVLLSSVDLRMALRVGFELKEGLQLFGHFTPNYILGGRAARQSLIDNVVENEEYIWILENYEPINEIFYGLGIRKEILNRTFLSAGLSSSTGPDNKLLYSFQLTQQF